MSRVVICEPVRTPIGRYGGMFTSLTAVRLGVAASIVCQRGHIMGEHRTPSNHRASKMLGTSLVAGGMLFAAPAGMAFAAPTPTAGSAVGNNLQNFLGGVGKNLQGIAGGTGDNLQAISGGFGTNLQNAAGGTGKNVQGILGGLGNNLQKIFGGGSKPVVVIDVQGAVR